MLREFKAFIVRGNVVDLAVGVVIGAAFGDVVDSLVADVLTPFISIPGETNFDSLSLKIGGGVITYGRFLNTVISFLTIAAAVFIFIVKPLGKLMARRGSELEVTRATNDCPHCLSAIPSRATVCSFCTRDVIPTS